GLEMAENLINLGIETTIVERHDHILKTLDYEMACYLQGVIKNRGINIFVNATVKGFEERNGRIYTIFEEDIPIQTDLIILALGVVPDTDFLAGSGIELSIKNAIIVNEHMETSITDIYAVGDAVEVKNFVTGKKNLVPLAGPANKQGRIVANNICGINSSYKGSLGSAIIKLFDYTVATTGITEKQAMEENIDYNKVIVIPPSHASYYPEAKNLVAKVVFENGTGRILGAQIVGEDGVDKRCDIFATAIKAKMTAEDLADLEVCYAPPYSSAKDLVNMAGFTMENVLAGRLKQIHFDDVDNLDRKYYFILDVRNRDEFAQGHIRKAVNIPLDELRENIDKIDKRKIICINCKTGVRSYIAYCMLTQMGFDCLNLSGGFLFYRGVLDGRFDIGYNNFESGIKIATKD
ncbi:MAG: FAD-dependent oxidoreductase, partial [Anaerotignaceae bacterium]